MSGHRVRAIMRRLLQGFRRDRRTLALLFVAPIVILGLLGYLMRGSTSAPSVGIVNEDTGPLGAVVADSLRHSTRIATSDVSAGIRAWRAACSARASAARAAFVRRRRIAIPATTSS